MEQEPPVPDERFRSVTPTSASNLRMAAPRPANEAERLAALRSYQVLDSPPEQEYEDLVLLASTICEAPIAVLTLVDSDRQWFKAIIGLDESQTSRDVSFCAHTILGTEVMEIPDAVADERFAGNPLVTGDHRIRFYAGAPLIDGDGLAIGTLCVFDRSPGRLRPEQAAALTALSRQAMSLLELRRTANELQNKEAATRAIIDTAGDAFVSMDAEGLVTDWNPQAETLFGWSRAEVMGQSIGDLAVPPRVRQALRADLAGYLSGGQSHVLRHRFEANVLHRDGHLFPVDVILWPLKSGGEVTLNAFVRDGARPVLDLKAIQEVREAHDLFRSVLAATTGYAIIGTDLQGNVTFFNVGAEKMSGYRSGEVVGHHTAMLLHDAEEIGARASELGSAPGFGVLVASALGGRVKTREWTYVRKDGVRLVVSLSVTTMKGADGTLAGFIVSAFDVTARRRADDLRSELATIVETSDDAIMSIRTDGVIRSWNPAAERLYGYRAGEAIGQPISMLRRSDRESELGEMLARLERGEKVPAFETVRIRKDGSEVAVALTISPILGATRDIIGWSAIARDITERRRNEAVVLDALAGQNELVERLQELDRAKTDFVSSVSHELRTPLSGVLGYVEMLAAGDAGALQGEQLRILEVIDLCTRRLSLLIEDLLTVSRVEAGTFRLDPGPVEIGPLVDTARQAVVPMLVKRHLEISIDHPERPTTIWADGSQLERMLTNLLTNAIKFTPDGGRIRLSWRPVDEVVELTVSDTGIGIPLEEQPMLFDRFFRSSGARELAVPGTGLGLGIVKSIVDEHGGSIVLTSTPHQGTEVVVTLPRALVAQPSPTTQKERNRPLTPVEQS